MTRADTTGYEAGAGLIDYLDASPTPFHACAQSARLLTAAGFRQVAETEAWPAEPGGYFLIRGGSLLAWSTRHSAGPTTAIRLVGAHTDSPNFRIKPQPDLARAGWQLLGVEPYGGLIAPSWMDRDLGLAGRVAVRDSGGVSERLFHAAEPLLRISRLAIHLDRSAREGEQLNPQQHLVPHWGLGQHAGDFTGYLADQLQVAESDVLAWDAMTFDLQPAAFFGRDRELIAGARMDNLATSYAGTVALIRAHDAAPAAPTTQVLALFDHEEIGSVSERGAQSALLMTTLERITHTLGGGREELHRALAASVIASGDMAHATHPNYADRHEPQHQIAMNGGPVLKVNTNLRYATDSVGAAAFSLACEQAGVPVQRFVVRSDLPCGSTVGPITSALTGVTTVDFGAPTLSMHSVRELVGTQDQRMYADALTAFLSPA
ncbi:M18 family aminopeptidase [Flexivirga caeni]|uniref:M18 family aminopeptidase n=1 Tax=Flexivirga caeni TaxID=2294115 RepID=A0A3M9MBD7_9MICO|nr:M18 family aminopeptidase [Flexivirga caeni]RNI22834.1 M18 family aminopeptidase [Flexivirga caeni]